MARRILTVTAIDELRSAGETELLLGPTDIVTDLAREHARDLGLRLVVTGTDRPAVPEVPDRDAPDDRAADREAVRLAVIAELGREPEGLDAAIARVLSQERAT